VIAGSLDASALLAAVAGGQLSIVHINSTVTDGICGDPGF
jgi:hypothetical protein